MKHFFRRFFGNDHDLIKALQEGNQQVWSQVYKEYKNKVLGTLIKKGATEEEAKVAYQDAWVHVYEVIHTLDFRDGKARFSTYVTGVAINKLNETWKRGKKNPEEPFLPEDLNWLEEALAYLFTSSSEECMQLLEKALQKMSKKHCNEIFEFRFWHQLSLQEIAQKLGLNYGHIREQSSQCIAHIRQLLTDMGYHEECF
jgi:RNA polymerase sigma-70 factor, ECF subfamily